MTARKRVALFVAVVAVLAAIALSLERGTLAPLIIFAVFARFALSA